MIEISVPPQPKNPPDTSEPESSPLVMVHIYDEGNGNYSTDNSEAENSTPGNNHDKICDTV